MMMCPSANDVLALFAFRLLAYLETSYTSAAHGLDKTGAKEVVESANCDFPMPSTTAGLSVATREGILRPL